MIFNHEKLKANEVEGINSMTKNINDPISPIEEDNVYIISFPITPPKLSRKQKYPIEQKHINKSIELNSLTKDLFKDE